MNLLVQRVHQADGGSAFTSPQHLARVASIAWGRSLCHSDLNGADILRPNLATVEQGKVLDDDHDEVAARAGGGEADTSADTSPPQQPPCRSSTARPVGVRPWGSEGFVPQCPEISW